MHDIAEGNIDVINISAGKYHRDCNAECRLCMATDDVVDNGSVVVPGAGNRSEDESLGVFCPAKSPKTIGVGMSETLCTATPKGSGDSIIQGPSGRPPGSYWVEPEEKYPFYPDNNYCGHGACSPFHDCVDNQKTVYWDGNVAWDQYLPEVVAPGHFYIESQDGNVTLEPGTSYSCAAVSGGIASALSDTLPNTPSPSRVRRVVEATSTGLECGPVGKFDMSELKRVL